MNFKLTSRNLEVTPAMENVLTKKLSRLDKFFSKDVQAFVSMAYEKGQAKLEVTIPIKGSTFRSEQTGNDLYALMDIVTEALEGQLRKHRGKLQKFYQSGGPLILPEAAEEPEEEQAIKIVRTKRFAVKPMDAVEACLQMDLLGHDFYMFLNSETNEVNVVYRRNQGSYGLIEPVLGDDE